MKTETKTPKKIGRPRIYKEPMTTAERQQRWRDRVRSDALELLALLKLNSSTG